MSFDPKGYALAVGGGTSIWFLDTLMTIKAGGEETNGAFTLLEWAAPVGFGPPLHRHDREDEAFYLINGAIEVTCGDQQWTVSPGGFVFLPRGIPHSFIVSAGPVRGLQITTPSGFERFIGELGIPAAGPGLPPPMPPDIPRLIDASSRNGMEILGPPPQV
jgi:quercetin dioxygenase-like cupin family protein